MTEQGFDLDEFIGSQADSLKAKHAKLPEPRIAREIRRVSHEQNARERIIRQTGPKMKYRDRDEEIWTPRYRWPNG